MSKLLKDLRVADLKVELERRSLTTSGVKAVLVERLLINMQEKGQDPETHVFGQDGKVEEAEEVEQNGQPGKGRKENEEADSHQVEDDCLNIEIAEEDADFDSNPSQKVNDISNGPASSPPRPETAPVVRPFTSKDTISMHSRDNKAHSENSSMFVHMDEESIGIQDDEDQEIKPEQEKSENPEPTNQDTDKLLNEKVEEPEPEEKKSLNLWISNLNSKSNASELRDVFAKYGKVSSAKILQKFSSEDTTIFGLVAMAHQGDADKCVKSQNDIVYDGKSLKVQYCHANPRLTRPLGTKLPVSEKKSSSQRGKTHGRRSKSHERRPQIKTPRFRGQESLKKHHITDAREQIRAKQNQSRNSGSDRHTSRTSSYSNDSQDHRNSNNRQPERSERKKRDNPRPRPEVEDLRKRVDLGRKNRDEEERLRRQREELKREREKLEQEKKELVRFERERQRAERERLEREKAEIEHLRQMQRQDLDYSRRTGMKRSGEAHDYYLERKRNVSQDQYSSRYGGESDNHYFSRRQDYGGDSRRQSSYNSSSRHVIDGGSRQQADTWSSGSWSRGGSDSGGSSRRSSINNSSSFGGNFNSRVNYSGNSSSYNSYKRY